MFIVDDNIDAEFKKKMDENSIMAIKKKLYHGGNDDSMDMDNWMKERFKKNNRTSRRSKLHCGVIKNYEQENATERRLQEKINEGCGFSLYNACANVIDKISGWFRR